MPAGKSPSEPSMEEIIASISRIIAEDKPGAERPVGATAPGEAAGPTKTSDILELTQVVDEDGSVRRVSPWAGNATKSSRAAEAQIASLAGATVRIEPQASRADPVLEPRLGSSGERI